MILVILIADPFGISLLGIGIKKNIVEIKVKKQR